MKNNHDLIKRFANFQAILLFIILLFILIMAVHSLNIRTYFSDKYLWNVQIGTKYVLRGDYYKALPYIKESIKIEPERVRAHAISARIYECLGKENEANQSLIIIKSLGGYSDYYRIMGERFLNNNQPEKAIQFFNKCVAYDGCDFDCYFLKGKALIKLQNYSEATENIENAILLLDNQTCPIAPYKWAINRVKKIAYLYLEISYEKSGEKQLAEEQYKNAEKKRRY